MLGANAIFNAPAADAGAKERDRCKFGTFALLLSCINFGPEKPCRSSLDSLELLHLDDLARQVVFGTLMFVCLAAELSHHSNWQQRAQTRAAVFTAQFPAPDEWIAESESNAWRLPNNKNAAMSKIISNVDPIGHDYCFTPVVVDVPLVIVDYEDLDCLWYPDVMDKSTADRMAYSIMRSLNAEAFRVDVKIVLPSATDIRAVTADLDRLSSEPVRVKLLAN